MITVNELKYEKTFNLGSYQSEKIGVAVAIEGKSDPKDILKKMMSFVESRGESSLGEGAILQDVTGEAASPKKAVTAKKAAAPEQEEEAAPPKKAVTAKKAAAPEQEEVVEEVVEEVAPAKGKAIKSKNTPYNRADSLHKNLLSKMLDNGIKNWRAKAAKAKEISEKMNGEEFLDAEGLVLSSFQSAFLKEMA